MRRALHGLVLTSLVGAGLALVLGRFGARAWWLDLFAHFRIQCALVLLLALVLAAVLRRWRTALAAGLLLLLALALLAPYAVPEDRSSNSPPLRLLHFNLLSRNDHRAEVVRWISDSGADLVLLQEVDPLWAAALADTPGYRPLDLMPRRDNFGLAALVRSDAAVELTDISREQFAGLPAHALRLRHHGRPLALLGLHTLPPMSREGAATRDAQLLAAGEWAGAQRAAGFAPVILGDLNATPFSAGLAPLVAAGLRDSLDFGGLWTAASWPDLPWPLRIAIDHCWHDAGLVTVERALGPAMGSDHRPLQVALAWSAGQ